MMVQMDALAVASDSPYVMSLGIVLAAIEGTHWVHCDGRNEARCRVYPVTLATICTAAGGLRLDNAHHLSLEPAAFVRTEICGTNFLRLLSYIAAEPSVSRFLLEGQAVAHIGRQRERAIGSWRALLELPSVIGLAALLHAAASAAMHQVDCHSSKFQRHLFALRTAERWTKNLATGLGLDVMGNSRVHNFSGVAEDVFFGKVGGLTALVKGLRAAVLNDPHNFQDGWERSALRCWEDVAISAFFAASLGRSSPRGPTALSLFARIDALASFGMLHRFFAQYLWHLGRNHRGHDCA
eukprot:SAG31_NODE_1436_length_8345_cov_32.360660_2_plen_296_part_00